MVLKLADIEKRKQIILEKIKGKPDINENIWKRINKQKLLSKETYYNMRDGLIQDKIIYKKNLGRQVWLYLPEDEALFRKAAKIDKKDVEDKEKIRLRIAHTKDIKEKVIRPWLEQMKQKKGSILLTKNNYFYGENELLFSDFKKHLKFEQPDPFYELDRVKKIDKQFEKRKYTLKCSVQSIISQVFEESPALFSTEQERIKEVVDFSDEYDETRVNLSRWIIELMDLRRLHSDDIETFDEIYLDLNSSIKDNKSLYEYYVNDIYCGYIRKSDISKEEFQTEMDECIKTILKQITESKPIKNEIEQLHKINIVIEKHLKNMRASLEKHLRLEVLPGDCEYHYWVQSK